ncbi:hypothetical protein ACJX0J_031299 [Zea mays]
MQAESVALQGIGIFTVTHTGRIRGNNNQLRNLNWTDCNYNLFDRYLCLQILANLKVEANIKFLVYFPLNGQQVSRLILATAGEPQNLGSFTEYSSDNNMD